ncbi:FliA/WhiG family RNA polymerase sigma factor [Selenomonas caprae]|nr:MULTISPECIES: FliA/WhiG family RNA polymerase sigma factor [Selenomonas]TYZ28732.1 FliA/WhiG family RNA polymerase sigma factor [Selenomonas caprae]
MNQDENLADVTSLWHSYLENKTVELRNQLAEHYLPLVKLVAGRLAISLPAHVDRDDLLSSGFFGLMDAIDRYDMERKNKFETYAGVRIRGAMLDYLRSKDWLPVAIRQKIRRYEQTVYELETRLGRPANDQELAEALGLTEKELRALESQISVATVIPLDDYLRTDSPASAEEGPTERLEKAELRNTLAAAIERLPEKEKKVVALYYYEELTLKEISLILNLSEARISQLHTKAVFRLRGYLARMKASLV